MKLSMWRDSTAATVSSLFGTISSCGKFPGLALNLQMIDAVKQRPRENPTSENVF